MLSRVADALFWMNAYIERAENIARFIHVNMHLILDNFSHKEEGSWRPLINAMGDEDAFFKKNEAVTEGNVIYFLTFDETNPNSIISCISAARDNAKSIREIISSEMWEQINYFYLLVRRNSRKRKIENLNDFYKQVKLQSHLLTGLMSSTMLQNDGAYFGYLGRMLERADKTTRMVDVKCFILLPATEFSDSPYDILQWSALLKSLSAFEMYRKKHRKITSLKVVNFLLFNEEFPRSVKHCINSSFHAINHLEEDGQGNNIKNTTLNNLNDWLLDSSMDKVIQMGLHSYIDELQLKLSAIIDEIHKTYFFLDHAADTEHLKLSIQ